jgi:dTDP-4-dehydrorhamnose reductase
VRVLVTGASGQLGTDVVLACEGAGDDVVGVDRNTVDVTSRDDVLGLVGSVRPDAVVHCAAFTAVDRCESEVDAAFASNALAPRWVAEACRRFDAHLVHVSTDYVFDGTKPEPYVEWDVPNPLSAYGRSKLAGEQEVLGGLPGATVLRTSWVCGAHRPNMVKTALRLLAEQPELAFVDDQVGHPTFTEDLALLLRRLAVGRFPGIVHGTNQGAVSWCGFVRAVAEAAGHDPERVRPISTADLQPPRPAPRPANSVLRNAVLELAGEPLLPDFRIPLARLVAVLAG